MTVEPIRKILPYTGILVLLAALYVAYTFYTRHSSAQQEQSQQLHHEAESELDTIARAGGPALKITSFYAAGGKHPQLCYGVINAKSLTLDPPAEKVWPSLSRCFDVPAKAAHYTLKARDESGHTAEKSVDVAVQ